VFGTNHISIFERTLPWDHAAGILFLNEAGGKAARWDGFPYRPADRKTGLLGASSPKLWDEAAEIFGEIF
jgi:fructose-1,6-bisphosphatase/inositol monophosphatase family enzyme